MKSKLIFFILIGLLLSGFLPSNSDFVSDWVQIEPGRNSDVPYKLPHRAVDVHVWTPVYLEKSNRPDVVDWIQPAENVGIKIVYISPDKIVLANYTGYPVWVQVYAR